MEDVVAAFNKQFSGGINTEELFNCTRDVLPLSEQQYKIVSAEGTEECFRSEINCNLSTTEEIDEFVRNYSIQNDETLRKRTPKINKSSNKFRYVIYYRCQHRTTHAPSFNPVENVLSQKPSKRVKNTDCPFFSLCLKLPT